MAQCVDDQGQCGQAKDQKGGDLGEGGEDPDQSGCDDPDPARVGQGAAQEGEEPHGEAQRRGLDHERARKEEIDGRGEDDGEHHKPAGTGDGRQFQQVKQGRQTGKQHDDPDQTPRLLDGQSREVVESGDEHLIRGKLHRHRPGRAEKRGQVIELPAVLSHPPGAQRGLQLAEFVAIEDRGVPGLREQAEGGHHHQGEHDAQGPRRERLRSAGGHGY
jgi:hypothetical protein